jgi:two-component system chemotaxis response regulator CheY
MRVLIVEDDFTSRTLLQRFLKPYGESDIAVDGKEAIKAFQLALEEGRPYDLILLDIMMPEMDGQLVLQELRRMESEMGITGLDGAKIIMTTALTDSENVMTAFREQCDAYLVKPVTKSDLMSKLQELSLIEDESI